MTVSRLLPAFIATLYLALLAGCAGGPAPKMGPMPGHGGKAASHGPSGELPALPPAGSGRGGYYQDDGPGDAPPANLLATPDAEVRDEPLGRYANRPYAVFGKSYTPMLHQKPFTQRGLSSWYGKKFHGQKTASGELYDMYKMTAAHPTLPIPSYARITNVANGKSVVVRINDRGPFHSKRIVDVSYTAALKLGLLSRGSGEVTLERLLPNSGEALATTRRNAPEAGEADSAPAPAAVAASEEEKAAPASGFYVQLGAFVRAEKAAEVRARALAEGWGKAALDVVRSGTLHKVLSGPFDSRADAQEAARALPAALRLNPIVVQR